MKKLGELAVVAELAGEASRERCGSGEVAEKRAAVRPEGYHGGLLCLPTAEGGTGGKMQVRVVRNSDFLSDPHLVVKQTLRGTTRAV